MQNTIKRCLFILSALFIDVLISPSSALRSGDFCNPGSFGNGICKPLSECKSISKIKKQSNNKQHMCGIGLYEPLVCCPQYNQNPHHNVQYERHEAFPTYDENYHNDDPITFNNDYNYNFNMFKPPGGGKEHSQHDQWPRNNDFKPQRKPNFEYVTNNNDNRNNPTSKKPSFWNQRLPVFGDHPFNPPSSQDDFSTFENSNNFFPRPTSVRPKSTTSRPTNFNNRPFGGGSNSRRDTDNEGSQERPSWGTIGGQPSSNGGFFDDENQFSNKRISERKCEEYSKLVTKRATTQNGRDSVADCDMISTGLIVGGVRADAGEYPHMAALYYGERSPKCGGTLISDQYILTAAHCIDTIYGKPKRVRIGVLNVRDSTEGSGYGIAPNGITIHPQYKDKKKYNDIALIKLDRKVSFSKIQRPACLYQRDEIPVKKSVATGWGTLGTVLNPSDTLQKVELSLVNNRDCNQAFRTLIQNSANGIDGGITDTMICAGEKEGGRDTCTGDSGGPLQFVSAENKCVHNIIGVTSFGDKTCASKGTLGVYTRVSSFLPWIESIVWQST